MEAPNLGKPKSNHSKPLLLLSTTSSCLKISSKTKQMDKRKGKRKVDDLGLDLTICRKDNDSNPNSYTESKNRIVFSCKYCTMKFQSSQALGGHQNGHKREREIARRKQHHQDAAVLHRVAASTLRFHGSSGRSLGMQVHSSIHNHNPNPNPNPNPKPKPKPIYGSRQPQPLHQQPAVGRLMVEVGRFHGGWRAPAAVDGINGRDSSSELKTAGSQLDLSLKL